MWTRIRISITTLRCKIAERRLKRAEKRVAKRNEKLCKLIDIDMTRLAAILSDASKNCNNVVTLKELEEMQ